MYSEKSRAFGQGLKGRKFNHYYCPLIKLNPAEISGLTSGDRDVTESVRISKLSSGRSESASKGITRDGYRGTINDIRCHFHSNSGHR